MSGSKNGTLAIMAASLLGKGETVLRNVPRIGDVETMMQMLEALGVHSKWLDNNSVLIDATEIGLNEAPYELVKKMRASFCVLGPMLARNGYAKVAMPGGCDIGSRPIDFHVKGIRALGAQINIEHGFVEAECEELQGAQIYLNFPSAGATHHLMCTASLASGVTTIHNAAAEPEVIEVARFLKLMGANIRGEGTSTIRVTGVEELKAIECDMFPDRMEAGTFAVAAAITNGDVTIEGIVGEHVEPFIIKLREAGAIVDVRDNEIRVRANSRPMPTDIMTMPHPGFPTDLQQPFAALLSLADGVSVITENVYERRFKYVDELVRMGADVKQEGRTAVITGVPQLEGTQSMATDLRAGAALVCAALCAKGQSEISGVEHILRGYERFVEKLQSLGAQICSQTNEQEIETLCV